MSSHKKKKLEVAKELAPYKSIKAFRSMVTSLNKELTDCVEALHLNGDTDSFHKEFRLVFDKISESYHCQSYTFEFGEIKKIVANYLVEMQRLKIASQKPEKYAEIIGGFIEKCRSKKIAAFPVFHGHKIEGRETVVYLPYLLPVPIPFQQHDAATILYFFDEIYDPAIDEINKLGKE